MSLICTQYYLKWQQFVYSVNEKNLRHFWDKYVPSVVLRHSEIYDMISGAFHWKTAANASVHETVGGTQIDSNQNAAAASAYPSISHLQVVIGSEQKDRMRRETTSIAGVLGRC